MKNHSTITKLVVAFGVLLPLSLHAQTNQFLEGNEPELVTPENRDELESYEVSTLSRLQKIASLVGGNSVGSYEERYRIALTNIKNLIKFSHASQRKSEQLVRIVLNQALQITEGVPNPDGVVTGTAGPLGKSKHAEPRWRLLLESVDLAISILQYKHGPKMAFVHAAESKLFFFLNFQSSLESPRLQAELYYQLLAQWAFLMRHSENPLRLEYVHALNEAKQTLQSAKIQIDLGKNFGEASEGLFEMADFLISSIRQQRTTTRLVEKFLNYWQWQWRDQKKYNFSSFKNELMSAKHDLWKYCTNSIKDLEQRLLCYPNDQRIDKFIQEVTYLMKQRQHLSGLSYKFSDLANLIQLTPTGIIHGQDK